MENTQVSEKTSEDVKRPAVDVAPASLGPPPLEPIRQNTQGLRGLLARTKSKSNQPEDIRPDPTAEVPVVSSKTGPMDQRVSTHCICIVVEWQLMLAGKSAVQASKSAISID
jgi:hypothetical protein